MKKANLVSGLLISSIALQSFVGLVVKADIVSETTATVEFKESIAFDPSKSPDDKVPTDDDIKASDGDTTLKIMAVPSINFGQCKISSKDDKQFNALGFKEKDKENFMVPYVQIGDQRATARGWKLQVKLEDGKIKDGETDIVAEAGAELNMQLTHITSKEVALNKQTTAGDVDLKGFSTGIKELAQVNGNSKVVLAANKNSGLNEAWGEFGEKLNDDNKTEAIQLKIANPEKIKKGTFTGKLVWTLIEDGDE